MLTALEELDASHIRTLLQLDPSSVNTPIGGSLPLHHAIHNSSSVASLKALEALEVLLELGADPTLMDPGGQGCGIHAVAGMLAREPDFAVVALSLLLRETRVPLDSLTDDEGDTPLAVVVQQGRQLTGLDESAQQDGERAIAAGVSLLLDGGSGLMASSYINRPKAQGAGHSTLLHVAAEWAPTLCIEMLGASEEAVRAMSTYDERGQLPLNLALAAGRSEAAQVLLRIHPEVTLHSSHMSPDGAEGGVEGSRSALHAVVAASVSHPARHSTRANHPDCLRLLVQQIGQAIDLQDGAGRTPLALAAELGCAAPLVSKLLQLGARIDTVDRDGRCPLMVAAAHGRAQLLGLLLGTDADMVCLRIHAHDCKGMSALALAAALPSPACVSKLLDAGADMQVLDAYGRCALLHAVRSQRMASVTSAATSDGGEERCAVGAPSPADALETVRQLLAVPQGGTASSLVWRWQMVDQASRSGGAVAHLAVAAGGEGDAVVADKDAAKEVVLKAASALSVVCDEDGECALAMAAELFSDGRLAPSLPPPPRPPTPIRIRGHAPVVKTTKLLSHPHLHPHPQPRPLPNPRPSSTPPPILPSCRTAGHCSMRSWRPSSRMVESAPRAVSRSPRLAAVGGKSARCCCSSGGRHLFLSSRSLRLAAVSLPPHLRPPWHARPPRRWWRLL